MFCMEVEELSNGAKDIIHLGYVSALSRRLEKQLHAERKE